MDGGSAFSWPMLVALLAVVIYFETMRRLDKHWANRTRLTDEERLWNHARNQGISEHEVFKRAAATWSLGPQMADADFREYLKSNVLPHYVRDYLRKLTVL